MTSLIFKRLAAVILTLILASFVILSPLIDVYGEHDHSCCADVCALCLTSNGISLLRKLCAIVPAYMAAVLLLLFFSWSGYNRDRPAAVASPVTLKIKITS